MWTFPYELLSDWREWICTRRNESTGFLFSPLPFLCLSVLPLPLPTHTRRSRITKEKMSSKTRQIIVDLGSSDFKLKTGSLCEARHVTVPLESKLKVIGAGGGGGKLLRSSIPPSGEVATRVALCYWNRRYGPFRPECVGLHIYIRIFVAGRAGQQ